MVKNDMSILEEVIRQLEDYILEENDLYGAGRIPFEHEGKTEYGYPYIRAAHKSFETALLACSQLISPPSSGGIRFLEVGCGIGTKCGIARAHGMQSAGFDLKDEYVALARKIFLECTFDQGNAFDFDYGGYDLVYYHVPFNEDSMLFQLETRILLQIPVGSVLFVTRFSDALQQTIYDKDNIKLSFRTLLFDPGLDVGRIRVLQKHGALTQSQLE